MYHPINNAQAKTVIDAEQVFSAYCDTVAKARAYHGGMHWKSIGGRDYLYRSLDRNGRAKSLGPRSEETEAVLSAFVTRKAELTERTAELKERVAVQAKVNAAFRVGHVPNEVADICEQLDKAQMLDRNVMVIGTNAMHAYEALTGVRFASDIMATVDLDLLWNHNSKLSLATTHAVEETGLLGLLKKADKTYEIKQGQAFRAISSKGYMVDLIRQMPDPPWADEPDRFFQDDMVATDIFNMKWMLGAPRIVQPAIALNGRVFNMSAPDPRAFAMFKLWLSQADDREPQKKLRDAAQATAVIRLIEDRLPHLAMKWDALKSFPSNVTEMAMEQVVRERQRS